MADTRDAEIQTLKLRIADLEAIVNKFTQALKESSQILQQVTPRPRRVQIPHERKLLLASQQSWKCADPYADGSCPLWAMGDGTFTPEFLPFHADHVDQWAKTYTNMNIRICCAMCHNRMSRDQRLRDLDERQAEGE